MKIAVHGMNGMSSVLPFVFLKSCIHILHVNAYTVEIAHTHKIGDSSCLQHRKGFSVCT